MTTTLLFASFLINVCESTTILHYGAFCFVSVCLPVCLFFLFPVLTSLSDYPTDRSPERAKLKWSHIVSGEGRRHKCTPCLFSLHDIRRMHSSQCPPTFGGINWISCLPSISKKHLPDWCLFCRLLLKTDVICTCRCSDAAIYCAMCNVFACDDAIDLDLPSIWLFLSLFSICWSLYLPSCSSLSACHSLQQSILFAECRRRWHWLTDGWTSIRPWNRILFFLILFFYLSWLVIKNAHDISSTRF